MRNFCALILNDCGFNPRKLLISPNTNEKICVFHMCTSTRPPRIHMAILHHDFFPAYNSTIHSYKSAIIRPNNNSPVPLCTTWPLHITHTKTVGVPGLRRKYLAKLSTYLTPRGRKNTSALSANRSGLPRQKPSNLETKTLESMHRDKNPRIVDSGDKNPRIVGSIDKTLVSQ